MRGAIFIPWILLGIVLLLRENRNWRAWTLALPAVAYMPALSFLWPRFDLSDRLTGLFVVVAILWFLLERLTRRKLTTAVVFVLGFMFIIFLLTMLSYERDGDYLYGSLTGLFAAVSISWLLSERLTKYSPFTAILFIVGLFFVMWISAVLGCIAENQKIIEITDGGYGLLFRFAGTYYALGMLIHLGTLLGARYVCRKRYTPVKFRIALLLFHAVPIFLILSPHYCTKAVEFTEKSLLGLVFLSPYLLIVFAIPFHRKRFLTLFRLEEGESR